MTDMCQRRQQQQQQQDKMQGNIVPDKIQQNVGKSFRYSEMIPRDFLDILKRIWKTIREQDEQDDYDYQHHYRLSHRGRLNPSWL